jgi:hypothetical protein
LMLSLACTPIHRYAVDRWRIDHLIIGGEVAVVLAEARPGHPVRLGPGAREAVMVAGAPKEVSDGDEPDAVVVAGPAARPPRAKCLQESFHLLDLMDVSLPDFCPLKVAKKTLSRRNFQLTMPSKWGMPGVELRQKLDSLQFLRLFNPADFNGVLQVHLVTENTSLHCVAVKDGLVADPDFGVWLPLTLASLQQLDIDYIVTGLRVV